jgi:hypothetical protein
VRAPTLAVLLLLAAAAAIAVLLGRAVLSLPDDMAAQDARLARPDLAAGAETGDGGPFQEIAEALAGAGDDRSYRRALRLYHASRFEGLAVANRLALQGEAEAILTRVVRTDGDNELRSRAANLLGVLFLADARLDPSSTRRYLDLSLGAFEDAVRFDPGYTEAKRNLELLASLPPDLVFAEVDQPGSEASATPPSDPGY